MYPDITPVISGFPNGPAGPPNTVARVAQSASDSGAVPLNVHQVWGCGSPLRLFFNSVSFLCNSRTLVPMFSGFEIADMHALLNDRRLLLSAARAALMRPRLGLPCAFSPKCLARTEST